MILTTVLGKYRTLLVIFFIFILDRITKKFIVYLSKKELTLELFKSTYININLVWNEGLAFGLFSLEQGLFYNIISILIFLIILFLISMLVKSKGLNKISLSFVIGGALGNLYDRVFFSAVPDFIDFHIKDFHWFIFNIADIFITIGILMLIINENFIDKKDKNYEF